MDKGTSDKWATLMKINKEIDDLYHNVAVYFGFSESDFWIIYSLYEKGDGLTQKEICSNWAYSKQTINSAIKKLLNLKYIEMEAHVPSNHGRKIYLTPLGKNVAEKTVEKVMQAEEESFSKIKEEDMDKVINVFNKTYSLFKNEVEKIMKSSEDKIS